jgi:hypothetical protein
MRTRVRPWRRSAVWNVTALLSSLLPSPRSSSSRRCGDSSLSHSLTTRRRGSDSPPIVRRVSNPHSSAAHRGRRFSARHSMRTAIRLVSFQRVPPNGSRGRPILTRSTLDEALSRVNAISITTGHPRELRRCVAFILPRDRNRRGYPDRYRASSSRVARSPPPSATPGWLGSARASFIEYRASTADRWSGNLCRTSRTGESGGASKHCNCPGASIV